MATAGEEEERRTDHVENEVEVRHLAEVEEMHHRIVGVGELGLDLREVERGTLVRILTATRMPTKNTIARNTMTRFFN